MILQAISTVVSFLAFMKYVFIWRNDLEVSIGSWPLGLLEGIIIATLVAVVVLAFILLRRKTGKKEQERKQSEEEKSQKTLEYLV